MSQGYYYNNLICTYDFCPTFLFTYFHADIDVISKFAQYEFRYGEPERGRTMFESLLSSYPRRVDLWSVYIDMVTRLGDKGKVRWVGCLRVLSARLNGFTLKMKCYCPTRFIHTLFSEDIPRPLFRFSLLSVWRGGQ